MSAVDVEPVEAVPAGPVAAWQPPSPLSGNAELPRFPIEVLPGWASAVCEALALEHQVPVDLPAILTLAVVSGAASARVTVSPGNRDWHEPLNLYLAVALGPGVGKTPVFKKLMRAVYELAAELVEEAKPSIAKDQMRYDIVKKRAEAAMQRALKASDEERADAELAAGEVAAELAGMRVPVRPRLLADDATPEALATLLADHEGRMALLSDEGGVFRHMGGAYQGGMANLDVYLKSHTAGTLMVDRRGREELVRNAHLTIGLAVQPDRLRALGLNPDAQGTGLVARFLFSWPADTVGARVWDADPCPPALLDGFTVRVKQLWTTFLDRRCELRLSPAALKLFAEFQARTEVSLGLGGTLEGVRDWGAKLPGTVLRLAGVLHLMSSDVVSFDQPVSPSVVRDAIRLADYFAPHFLAAYDLMSSSSEVAVASRVLDWVKAKRPSQFSQRDAFRALQSSKIESASLLVKPLELLVERGWLRALPQEPSSGRGGRPPSPVFVPHPSLLAGRSLVSGVAVAPAAVEQEPVAGAAGDDDTDVFMQGLYESGVLDGAEVVDD